MSLEFVATPFAPLPVRSWSTLVRQRAQPAVAALRPAFLASGEAARTQLDRLLTGDGLCVTTGQQPGLFTGPLYTIYKAVSAVVLARRLEELVERPVVPVFWVAGDDHDYAEASECHVLTPANEIRRLALPPRPPEAPLTPMYREPLDGRGEALVAQLGDTLPPSEFRDEVLAWLSRHYGGDTDLATAFAGAVAELLERFGLVVFRPTHPVAKTAMRPLLLRALTDAEAVERGLSTETQRLAAAGRPTPVPVGDGATLVMLEGPGGRDRLIRDHGTLHARRSGERYTIERLTAIAERSPERFSPNVLLRPVVEAALLPTVAYVAGPGELGYLPQTAPVYRLLEVVPQEPVARWSGLVLEGRVRKVLDKYSITPDDLQLPEGQLEQRLVRDDMPASALHALAALREAVAREYPRLQAAAVEVDPTLRKPVESAQHAAETGLRDVEKRLLSHLKHQNEILVQQLAKARQNLFPLGRAQERVLNVAPYLARYGPAFLDDVERQLVRWVAALEPLAGAP